MPQVRRVESGSEGNAPIRGGTCSPARIVSSVSSYSGMTCAGRVRLPSGGL
ncbi:MAG: hypothetical protein NTW86_33020 [Candidatus Sumerlaeota bacterium]|nr:hypothetical protein [Candidatus Sumerlaeota bacterium]